MSIFYRLFLIVSISLFPINFYGQEGTPLITNFSFGELSIDNESWAMAQDIDGQMLFANRRGIVTFDGIKWNTISTPSVPLSLFYDHFSSTIFVGCKNNIGHLIKQENGVYKYENLFEKNITVGTVSYITTINENVFFYSESCITRYNTKTKEKKQWLAAIGEPYTGFIINNGKAYVNIDKLGLHLLKENVKTPIKEGAKFSNLKILFNFRYTRAQSLIGASNDSIYLFNGESIAPFYYKSNEYIQENILSGGIDIDPNTFVLSTITGGCLVIDKNTKETIHTINYQTGLPDDEVYSLGIDRNKGLWVLHEYGMTRVDLKLPVRNLNNYPGLEGNLTSLIEFDSTLYVSTSEGVYYLTEVKNYNEIEVLVKVNKEKTQKNNDSQNLFKNNIDKNSQKNSEENVIKKEEKTGLLGKIFGKKRKKKNGKKEIDSETTTNENTIESQKEDDVVDERQITSKSLTKVNKSTSIFEKQKIYALQSISHKFNKINGIDGKVKQFVRYKNKILVASNTGLFQIENLKVTPIVNDRYINYIHKAKSNPNKFYIGTTQGLLIVVFENGKWNIIDNFSDFTENVYSILELSKNNIWIGSENVAYNLLLDNSDNPVNIKSYQIKSNFTERILVRNVFGIPYFFLSTGLYSYNLDKDSIIYNTKTNKGFTGQSKYIFSQDNITWVFNEFKWVSINELSRYVTLPEEFLEIFENISNVYVDSKNNIWIIDDNNSIYKIINTKKDYEEIFDIYLQFISGKHGKLLSLTNLSLEYDNNALSFNVSAPYFVKSNAISFQYFIEGLTNEWSDWRKDLSIDFPYIPDGKYKLHIKAKNILGKQTTIKTFSFVVNPPYWKRWWFYVIILISFSMLILFVIRYRDRQLRRTQKILEEKVTIRTQQLVKEKAKTEELLLNILPQETATELKQYGKAKARHYDFASVMFTDFKGFTFLAEKLTSTDLVKEIDYCFSNFDDIIEKYHIEKIKTIGDAYMCAAGIPKENSNNPILLSLAGLEILQFMENHKKERINNKLPYFELRMGIHTGSLVSGVVGKKKFAYDIWGDTVNIAARLESSGQAGMLNVSEKTYNVIKEYFECEYRGKIEAKNKGEISMYFVNRIKKEYSKDEFGFFANEYLMNKLNL